MFQLAHLVDHLANGQKEAKISAEHQITEKDSEEAVTTPTRAISGGSVECFSSCLKLILFQINYMWLFAYLQASAAWQALSSSITQSLKAVLISDISIRLVRQNGQKKNRPTHFLLWEKKMKKCHPILYAFSQERDSVESPFVLFFPHISAY